mmetsp:Transcript_48783/g.110516  ORF Transcript_48783/g.110516 Transcript_48783/m.110516 type:complete len:247 (-) Transcript_48783:1441-2181(-)
MPQSSNIGSSNCTTSPKCGLDAARCAAASRATRSASEGLPRLVRNACTWCASTPRTRAISSVVSPLAASSAQALCKASANCFSEGGVLAAETDSATTWREEDPNCTVLPSFRVGLPLAKFVSSREAARKNLRLAPLGSASTGASAPSTRMRTLKGNSALLPNPVTRSNLTERWPTDGPSIRALARSLVKASTSVVKQSLPAPASPELAVKGNSCCKASSLLPAVPFSASTPNGSATPIRSSLEPKS